MMARDVDGTALPAHDVMASVRSAQAIALRLGRQTLALELLRAIQDGATINDIAARVAAEVTEERT